ncbi:MAG TPA: hypothetical protein VD947_04095 [Patescibacteria group bacterium]|nr:hypothetical protein [Patescibacteria group bacterium]
MSSVDPERRQEIRHTMPGTGVDYVWFLFDELAEVAESTPRTEYPAPTDLSTEQLEGIAYDLNGVGRSNVTVVPIEDGEDIRFGICIEGPQEG